MKNLLTECKDLIRPKRHCGNTTRQVDKAIDLLHQEEEVLVIDHNNNIPENLKLKYLISKRLEHMYNHLFGTKITLITKQLENGTISIKLNIK